jgi:RNA polymerase sigma factor (TIGR02999 family)
MRKCPRPARNRNALSIHRFRRLIRCNLCNLWIDTALVNEAYIRLNGAKVSWRDRAHFFGVFARLMRRLLVDHARANHCIKRESHKISLDEAPEISSKPALDLVALDQALAQFATFDPRKVEIIGLHFFGGLSNEEVADALGISRATVQRDLRLAKAWLQLQLK